MKVIKTVSEVIDLLGGNQGVATLADTTHKAVSMWRALDKFPANTYLVITRRLRQLGYTAPDSLWPMRGTLSHPQRRRA